MRIDKNQSSLEIPEKKNRIEEYVRPNCIKVNSVEVIMNSDE